MTLSAPIANLPRIPVQPSAGAPQVRPDSVPAPGSRAPESPASSTTSGSRGDAPAKPLLSGGNQVTAQEGTQGAEAAPGGDGTGENLTPEEKKKVQELQRRDREVRAHEQAHKLAGGPYAGHPTYKTVRGPDGRSYAVSGEVKIDTSTVPNNPDATIRKMEIVKRAALAPSNPSTKDRQVAAEAEAKIQQARQEKQERDAEEREQIDNAATPGTLFNVVA